jgi:hypothetical protein
MRIGVYMDAFNVYYGPARCAGAERPAGDGLIYLAWPGLALDLIDPDLWPGASLRGEMRYRSLHTTRCSPLRRGRAFLLHTDLVFG